MPAPRDAEALDRRVRDALGPSPTPADRDALQAAVDHLRAGREAFLRAEALVTSRAAVHTRTLSPLDAALHTLERELAVVVRSLEPLDLGQTVRVATQVGPRGIEAVDMVFQGVDAKGFILLKPPSGVFTAHRAPGPGFYGLYFEEHHRVERWLAARRAAGLPTTLPRGSRAKKATHATG